MNWDAVWNYADSYEWMKRAGKFEPLIVSCAVNGGVQGKEAHAAIPETADEVAEAAAGACEAGASIIHIHGRDPNRLWDCTGDPGVYLEINRKVRVACPEVIINNTTGGGFNTTQDDRLRQLDALPELASLNLGPVMDRFSMPPRPAPLPHPHDGFEIDECAPATYGEVEELAQRMLDLGVRPEIEIYSPGHFWVVMDLMERELIRPPYWFQFVLGTQTEIFPTPTNLLGMIREMPKGARFSVVGVGKYQWPLTTLSIILGGNVRVGLEDNLNERRGVRLQSNAEAVRKIVRIAGELGREVATPAQARELLGLPAKPRQYDFTLAAAAV
jgi:3-keto-5-aminohexanoate cleavage enzyme